jgi:hypothetical protein
MIKHRLPAHIVDLLRVAATCPDRAARNEAWHRYLQFLAREQGRLL